MNQDQLLFILDSMDTHIEPTPHISKIRCGVREDRRRNLNNLSEKSLAWQKHRADAVAFCQKIIRQHRNIPIPIDYAFAEDFSNLVKSLSAGNLKLYPNQSGIQNAFREHWQLAPHLSLVRQQIFTRDVVLDRLFREFLNKNGLGLPQRPRGRAHSKASRNVLIASMLQALSALGWGIQRNPETKLRGSAIDIVHDAFCKELEDSKNRQFKPDMITKIWKQHLAHKKVGVAYLGTSLKARKSGALHLITHAK